VLGEWLLLLSLRLIIGEEGPVLGWGVVGSEPVLLSRGLGVVWRSARHDGRVPGADLAHQGLVAPWRRWNGMNWARTKSDTGGIAHGTGVKGVFAEI